MKVVNRDLTPLKESVTTKLSDKAKAIELVLARDKKDEDAVDKEFAAAVKELKGRETFIDKRNLVVAK